MARGLADWDKLLRQSESTATQDSKGHPQIGRDLQQIELFSEELKDKLHNTVVTSDQHAATRLLAEQGVNGRRINKALVALELKPAYEDLLQVEYTSTDEYLRSLHQTIVTTAIKEAQLDTLATFDDYMESCLRADWAADKRSLLDAVVLDSYDMNGASPVLLRGSSARAPGRGGTASTSAIGWPEAKLVGREKGYAEVVAKMNEPTVIQDDFDPVAGFLAAANSSPEGLDRRATVKTMWEVVKAILRDSDKVPPSERTHSLLRGARRFLESSFASVIRNTIQSNRAQANLGGTPTSMGLVKAYIRIVEKGSGPLDFDAHGGMDTTWQRIYLALRAGFHSEAVEEAKSSRELQLSRGTHFAEYLADWVRGGGCLSAEKAAVVANECERLARTTERASWQKPNVRAKLTLYALLSASRRTADFIGREFSGLFATLEDFMWFHIGLVRIFRSEPGTSSSSLVEAYTLGDLQTFLTQYPPNHYTSGGKEPMLYVVVLLLSLQFRSAIAFLAKDPSAIDFRVDAPHLAIAAYHAKVLDTVGESKTASLEPGQLVRQYGQRYLRSCPALALNYFLQAALMLADGDAADLKAVRGKLLRELLTQSNAFGYLLGSGGLEGGGALAKFVTDPRERLEVVETVAAECERGGQLDWAIELFMYAGAGGPALRLICQELSSRVEEAASDPHKGEELEKVIRRGQEAARMLTGVRSAEEGVQLDAFKQLLAIRELLFASHRGDDTRVVELMSELPFIPQDDFLLQRKADAVSDLPPSLAQRLSSVLLALARALAAKGQVARLRLLVAFAGNVPHRISQATFKELNQLHNSVMSLA